MQKLLLLAAVSIGAIITFIDTRPGWDDTGISAVTIFLSCSLISAISPDRPWVWALAVGLWIPIIGIFVNHNNGSVLALVIAFAGAYIGMAARKITCVQ